MTHYVRPLVQSGTVRPGGSVPLLDTRLWFSHVELLSRSEPSRVVPARDLPGDLLAPLSEPRAALAGLDLRQPQIMGILNVTPDSFSDGGRHAAPDAAVARAQDMQAQGATIIDIGGESTRPGAECVPSDVEMARIIPVIEALRAKSRLPVSVDTRKADVARAALAAGADLVNDVSGFAFDPALLPLCAEAGAPVCVMHAQGDPETMQDDPRYGDVLLDVYDFLAARVAWLDAAGIPRSRIAVDPGIGFGKTEAHNLALLRGLSLFHGLGCAILLGVSRKGFIGRIGQQPDAAARAPGSIAVGLAALAQGVQVLRVHDVADTAQAVRLWQAVT